MIISTFSFLEQIHPPTLSHTHSHTHTRCDTQSLHNPELGNNFDLNTDSSCFTISYRENKVQTLSLKMQSTTIKTAN